MDDPEDFKVVQAMTKYGGSFVKALAEAFHHADHHADHHNVIKLKYAFPEYWEQYKKMANGE